MFMTSATRAQARTSFSRPMRAWPVAAPLLAFALGGAPAVHAEPQEYCVTCSGPAAQYRCTFDGNEGPRHPGLQLYCISTLAREGGHESCAIGRASKTPCQGTLKVLALPDQLPAAPSAPESADTQEAAPSAPPPAAEAVPSVEPPQADVEMQGVRTPPAADVVPAAPAPETAARKQWSDSSGQPAKSGDPSAAAAPQPAGTSEPAAAKPADQGKPLEDAGKAVGDAAKSTGSALEKAGDAVGNAAKKTWKCLTSLFGDC